MSDGVDPTINGRPISELKVVELKEELSKRGLSKVGNKNVLHDRLKKFLLDDSGDGVVSPISVESPQVHDTPSSPPANPLVAEYLAKQEAALREARKDAEAALRSSSGEETSPSPKKPSTRGRKARVSSSHVETDEPVIEVRKTRSKTRSETEQEVQASSSAEKEERPRKELAEEPVLIEEPTKESVSREEPVLESVSKEEPMKESVSREEPAQESVSREEPVQETVLEEEPVQESVSKEGPVQEPISKDQPVQECVSIEEPVHESISKEEPVQGSISKEELVQECVSIEEPVHEFISKEEPVQGSISKEEPVQESISKEGPVQESISKEEPVQESISKDESLQESVSSEEPIQEFASKEESTQEPVVEQELMQESVSKEQAIQESASKEDLVQESVSMDTQSAEKEGPAESSSTLLVETVDHDDGSELTHTPESHVVGATKTDADEVLEAPKVMIEEPVESENEVVNEIEMQEVLPENEDKNHLTSVEVETRTAAEEESGVMEEDVQKTSPEADTEEIADTSSSQEKMYDEEPVASNSAAESEKMESMDEKEEAKDEADKVPEKPESVERDDIADTEELTSAAEDSRDSLPASTSLVASKENSEKELSGPSGELQESETIRSPSPEESISLLPVSSSPPTSVSKTEKVLEAAKLERKRRWKETSSSREINDKDVVTVTVADAKTEEQAEKEQVDGLDTEERPDSERASIEKEEVLEADDKDEELDYEEPLDHASPISESSKFAKHDEEEPEKRKRKLSMEKSNDLVELDERSEKVTSQKLNSELKRHHRDEHSPENDAKRRRVSPARYPISEFLLIRQLTRPFTVKQLKSLLGNYGTLVEDGFWIDGIKSKCIVKYSSKEEATVARGELHNLVWPVGNPKELKVDFIDEAGFTRFSKPEEKEAAKTEPASNSDSQPSASLRISVDSEQRMVSKRAEKTVDDHDNLQSNAVHERSPRSRHASEHGRSSPARRDERRRSSVDQPKTEVEKKTRTADELFQKTKTQPAIYYAPLTDEQIIERAKLKSLEAEAAAAKRTVQGTAREERRKEIDLSRDSKYRLSPLRRQRSPFIPRRRRPSRSRSRSPARPR